MEPDLQCASTSEKSLRGRGWDAEPAEVGNEPERTYTFAELSEQAKDKVRERYCVSQLDHGWWDSTYEDAVRMFEILGFSVEASDIGFDDYASWFSGWFEFMPDCLAAIQKEAPQDEDLARIASELTAAFAAYSLANVEVPKTRISSRWNTGMSTEVEDFYEAPEHLPDVEDVVSDAAEALASWLRSQLSEEEDWLISAECLDPIIESYDDRYDEDGDTI